MGSVSTTGAVSEATSSVCLRTITFSNMVSMESSSLQSFYGHKHTVKNQNAINLYKNKILKKVTKIEIGNIFTVNNFSKEVIG